MKKIFDKGIFLNTVKQLVYLGVLMVLIGIALLILNINNFNLYYYADKSISYNITSTAQIVMTWLGSFCLSFAGLNFAWKKKKSDFEYSIPVTKGQLYFSKVIGIITMQTAVLMLVFVMGIILSFEMLGTAAFAENLFGSFMFAVIGSLIIISAVFLSVSITGKPLSALIMFVGIIIFPLFFSINRFYFITNYFSYDDYNFWFRPSQNVLVQMIIYSGNSFQGVVNFKNSIFSISLTVICFGLGYIMFKKRSGETTGVQTKNKFVHYIAMSIIPFIVIYIAALRYRTYTADIYHSYLYPQEKTAVITLLVSSLILVFAYDFFVHKKFRRRNRCIWVFIGLCALAWTSCWAIEKTVFYTGSKQIDLSKVESINVMTDLKNERYFDFCERASYGDYLAVNAELDDKELINLLVMNYNEQYLESNLKRNSQAMLIKFNLRSGRSVYKIVPIYMNFEDHYSILGENAFTKMMDIDEYASEISQIMPFENITHVSYTGKFLDQETSDAIKEVYEVFVEEYNQLSIKEKAAVKNSNFRSPNFWVGRELANSDGPISANVLYVKGRVEGYDLLDILYLTPEYTPKALEAYEKVMSDVSKEEEAKKR